MDTLTTPPPPPPPLSPPDAPRLDRDEIPAPLPGRPLWMAFGSLLLLGGLFWGTFQVVELIAHEEFTRNFEVSAAGLDRIYVDNDNGFVSIVGTDTDIVHVTAEVSEGLRETGYGYELIGSTMELHGGCPILGGMWCEVDYTIEVPRDFVVEVSADNGRIQISDIDNNLTVNGDNGAVALSNIDGNVILQSDNGRTELSMITGSIRANGDNGTIIGTNLLSKNVDVETDNGSIELRFAEVPDFVTGTGDNGTIEIVVPPNDDGYDVTTEIDNGELQISVNDNPASPHVIDLETDNGDLIVRPTG